MAIKKIRMRPEGANDYGDILHPETTADQVKFNDGSTVESHKADYVQLKDDTDNFKLDYEYQIAVVVGRQIQLQKLSDTSILKFKLNEDILDGTAITVSLDNGITSKPLQDFEGVQVTELEKGFVEVIADATFFTLRPKGIDLKFYPNDFVVGVEVESGVDIIINDDEFIYYSGQFKKIIKARKSDLVVVAESSIYPNVITAMGVDGDYIYFSNTSTRRIIKLNKSDLTKVAESPQYYSPPTTIDFDDDYVYGAGTSAYQVYNIIKCDKSNLSTVALSANITGAISSTVVDDDYIYHNGGNTPKQITRRNKSTLDYVSRSAVLTENISRLRLDNKYIFGYTYNSSMTQTQIFRFNIPSLTSRFFSQLFDFQALDIAIDDKYVYIARNNNDGVIFKLKKSDLTTAISTPPHNTGSTRRLSVDDKHIYYDVYGATEKIQKSNVWFQDYYKYKNEILTTLIKEE